LTFIYEELAFSLEVYMPLQRNSYPAQIRVRTLGVSSIDRRRPSLPDDLDGADNKSIDQV
jgi:hypothetical protein